MPSKTATGKKGAKTAAETAAGPAATEVVKDLPGQAAEPEADDPDADSDSDGSENYDEVELISEIGADDAHRMDAGEGGGGGGGDAAAEGGAGGEEAADEAPAHGNPHAPHANIADMKRELAKFLKKIQEYMADKLTPNGKILAVFDESQSPLDPLPDEAALLLEALNGISDPRELTDKSTEFFTTLRNAGFALRNIAAATKSVKSAMTQRDMIDSGRIMAYSSKAKLAHSGGGGAGGGPGLGAGPGQQGPATFFNVDFKNVNKTAPKDRSQNPPTNQTDDSEKIIKDMLIAIMREDWATANSKAEEYAVKNGTSGARPHVLFSYTTSMKDLVAEGAFQFGGSGTAGVALTVQVAGGAAQGGTPGLLQLDTKFSRAQHFALEKATLDDIMAGKLKPHGVVRVGDSLTVCLSGESHGNLHLRALCQERFARGMLDVIEKKLTYPDPLMAEDVFALARLYRAALSSSSTDPEAQSIARATEFGSAITPETLTLAYAGIPLLNIATNLALEFARSTGDHYSSRVIARITKQGQLRRKPGDSAEKFYADLEEHRLQLQQLKMPADIDFPEIGFSVNAQGVPIIVSSPNMNILTVMNFLYLEVPKFNPGSRLPEVITPEIFRAARQGLIPEARLKECFRDLTEKRVNTVPPSELAKASADGGASTQVGAFAAVPQKSGLGKPKGPGQDKPKVDKSDQQDRGRQQDRTGSTGGGTRRSLSRGAPPPPPKPTSEQCYEKSLAYVRRNSLADFLTRLNGKCSSLGEPLFEIDGSGDLATPLKLCGAHTWRQYGGKLGIGGTISNDVFAPLMLARDICSGREQLSRLGIAHGTNKDSSWTPATARALCSGLEVAGIGPAKSAGGKGNGGQSKGNRRQTTAAAAAASPADDTWLDE